MKFFIIFDLLDNLFFVIFTGHIAFILIGSAYFSKFIFDFSRYNILNSKKIAFTKLI